MAQHLTYRIKKWLGPLCGRYEDWLISQGRVEEAYILHQAIEELNDLGFYDYHYAPFEVQMACKQNYLNAFMVLVQGKGYPNLMDVGYANNL